MKNNKDLWSVLNISTFERRAALALLFVISLFILKYSIRYRIPHDAEPIDSAALAQLNLLLMQQEKQEVNSQAKLRTFNPNTDSVDSLMAKGIPSKLAWNIYNYRTKVRPFAKQEELKQLYSMTEVRYQQLYPYIYISQVEYKNEIKYTDRNAIAKRHIAIEINTAEAEEFQLLKGIGKVLSKRILAYRELLGGFVNTLQIKEVYGITDSLYAEIEPFLVLESMEIVQINVNTADFKSLLRHPYLDYEIVKNIVDMRENEGAITNLNQLFRVLDSDSLVFYRVLPYVQLKK